MHIVLRILQVHGLRQLAQIIDTFWAEAAGYISTIESLHEDRNFPERELAAYVASKVCSFIMYLVLFASMVVDNQHDKCIVYFDCSATII